MDSPSSSRGLSCEYHLVRSHKSPKKKRAAQISKPLENDRGRRHGWKLKERHTAQFRAEFFNFRNHADFGVLSAVDPEKGLGCSRFSPGL